MNKTIKPSASLCGVIEIPGDKSISHRALMMAAISEGESRISNLLMGDDVKSTWLCVSKMGTKIRKVGDDILVTGTGSDGLQKSGDPLDAGNSGTTVRLISGLLAALPFESIITGDASLQKRPMKRVVEPLTQMGAVIETTDDGYLPMTIHGGQLKPISYRSPIPSAQVKSCILLAGLNAHGVTSIVEPARSRDHTERMLKCFGAETVIKGLEISVKGPVTLRGCEIFVPGDISSAAFFIVAALLVENSELLIKKVGVNPTRTGLLDVLKQMGAEIQFVNARTVNEEPVCDLKITSGPLKAVNVGGELIPKLIDEIPLLAIAAARAQGTTIISDAAELRVKESDRIETVAVNLKKMGIQLQIKEDGFIIPGPQKLKGAVLDSYGDHRIAMAFSIAALLADGETTIRNTECADISFPGFFRVIDRISNG